MRVVVTGAAGQLGVDVVKTFTDAGDDVTGWTHTNVDVADREAVLQAIGAVRPDVVVHCATWTNVDGCETEPVRAYLVNALGARHIAEGARIVGARVVHVSTDYVFDGRGGGPNGGDPYTEWDPTNPISHYGRSKLGGEREMQVILGGDATVVRTSWLCGAHGSNFVKTMLRVAGEREQLTVVNDQRGCPTFTSDLARTLRLLAVARLPGTFHASNAGEVTWYEFARAIFAAAGLDPNRVLPITTDQLLPARPAPRPAYSVLDNAALRGLGLPAMADFHGPLSRLVTELTR